MYSAIKCLLLQLLLYYCLIMYALFALKIILQLPITDKIIEFDDL